MEQYQAALELRRVANLTAFNVNGYIKKKRYNQHCIGYVFPDGSTMTLYPTSGKGAANHPAWKGTHEDGHLRPIQYLPIRVNN